ncbi:MAG: F0F1 ATP synthase subunit delta [Oceanipulchritudo sp.]
MRDPSHSKLAKRLAVLVVESGEAGVAQIRPALTKLLSGRSAADRKAFLKAFHKAVSREIQKDTLTIESAQELPAETIDRLVADFSRERDRPLHLVRRTNPDLIAGIRARLGDSVYDASLSGSLQSLATRIR